MRLGTIRRGRTLRLGVLALVMALTACGESGAVGSVRDVSATTVTAAPLPTPSGYTVHEVADEGFEIALPDNWTSFGPSDVDFEQKLGEAATEINLSVFRESIAEHFAQGGVLIAFDLADLDDGFVDNLNVLKTGSIGVLPDALEPIVEEQYALIGAANIEMSRMTSTLGEGLMVNYDMPAYGSEGTTFTVPGDRYMWTITVSSQDLTISSIDPESVFMSFRKRP